MATSSAVPIRSSGATVVSRWFGSNAQPAITISAAIGTLT